MIIITIFFITVLSKLLEFDLLLQSKTLGTPTPEQSVHGSMIEPKFEKHPGFFADSERKKNTPLQPKPLIVRSNNNN